MSAQVVPVKLEANAVVAVDVVLFTVRETERIDDAWQVLLVQRDDAAFAGKWSLPGVLVRAEETFADAARRALRTKAGLDASDWYLDQVGTFGAPDRDTRVRSWVRAQDAPLDAVLAAAVGDWLRTSWPFTEFEYAPREEP